jgi:FkbM family methyltransferase
MTPSNIEKPWGAYTPSGIKKLLLTFIQIGLSHGAIKKWMQKLWFSGVKKEPVDIEYSGVKFRLQPWDNVVERKILFGSKRRDWKEIEFLTSHLNSDSIFFDIGANIGYYTCMLAASGVSKVIAVEPHPVTQARLKFNIDANHLQDKVTLAPIALGSSAGEVVLTTQGGDLGSSSVCNAINNDSVAQYKVEMISLRGLCEKLDISRIDAAKIDIEGLEDKVLIPFFDTAPASLWPHYIVIEHAHSTHWGNDLYAKIEQCGYKARIRSRANTIYQLQQK